LLLRHEKLVRPGYARVAHPFRDALLHGKPGGESRAARDLESVRRGLNRTLSTAGLENRMTIVVDCAAQTRIRRASAYEVERLERRVLGGTRDVQPAQLHARVGSIRQSDARRRLIQYGVRS